MISAMPRIRLFISTPLRALPGDPSPTANIDYVKSVCRAVSLAGGAPYAPHLMLPSFLDDDIPEERDCGIDIGLEYLTVCEEAWFALPKWRTSLSDGMRKENSRAHLAMSHGHVHLIRNEEELSKHLARIYKLRHAR